MLFQVVDRMRTEKVSRASNSGDIYPKKEQRVSKERHLLYAFNRTVEFRMILGAKGVQVVVPSIEVNQ